MPPRKTKSATLARVRDNQRRCRARKREYVVELERKLQGCEVAESLPDIEAFQSAVKRLENENRELRRLLSQVGVSKAFVDSHLREDRDTQVRSDDSNRTDGQSISFLQESSSPNEFGHGELHPQKISLFSSRSTGADQMQSPATNFILDNGRTSPSPSFGDLLNEPFLGLPGDFHSLDPTQSNPIDHPSTSPTAHGSLPPDSWTLGPFTSPTPDSPNILIAGSIPHSHIPAELARIRTAQNECGTTLCTVAYKMIRQHNKKGVDMIEIGIRLWNGFIKGDRDDEGCKVENKLLFSVLNDING